MLEVPNGYTYSQSHGPCSHDPPTSVPPKAHCPPVRTPPLPHSRSFFPEFPCSSPSKDDRNYRLPPESHCGINSQIIYPFYPETAAPHNPRSPASLSPDTCCVGPTSQPRTPTLQAPAACLFGDPVHDPTARSRVHQNRTPWQPGCLTQPSDPAVPQSRGAGQ